MSVTDPVTQSVLEWFGEIAKIPRCSKHEEQIGKWLLEWAKEHSLEADMDGAGNVVIRVPGTAGYEKSPAVVIQGHQDMVCEKTMDSTHDFSKDPIELVIDGEWLTANKTTLGADNGIAIAMSLAMALNGELAHPPLELLFTVDEETGLTGANRLEEGFIKGKILLNVDSEDEGVFTVGCAGGNDCAITLPIDFDAAPAGKGLFELRAGGLRGGHSGVDIHEQRANAIKVLFRAFDYIAGRNEVALADVKGGSAHNAIPRDAHMVLFIDKGDLDSVKADLADIEGVIKQEVSKIDPNLSLTIEPSSGSFARVLTPASMKKVVNLVIGLPHGVAAYSYVIEGLVETSNNLATVGIEGDNLKILSSQRSSLLSLLSAHARRLAAIAQLAGGTAHIGEGYPPWEANWDSPLLARCKEVYKKTFSKDPVVEVIHAGLECGIIGDKYPGMDMISIGPSLKNPHSPDEKLLISDIKKIWDFIAALLKELK